METNMNLTVGFVGSQKIDGMPIFNHDGAPYTVGGIIDPDNTETAYFGYVVSEDSAAPDQFLMGVSGGDTVIGILQNDNSILQNDPAKPTYIMGGMPATAIFFGPMWIGNWTHAGTGALTTPVKGCQVMFKNTTGQIEFLAAGDPVPTGYTLLNARVCAYYPSTNYVLLFVGVTDTERDTPVPTSTKKMTSFGIVVTGASGFASLANIVESTGAISVTVPYGTNVTALKGQFTYEGASIAVGATAQVSGVTANNFTSPVEYVITAADGTEKTYTVTVTAASASATKKMKSFGMVVTGTSGWSAIGNIVESTGAISITVPNGTTVTALVAQFDYEGASIAVGATAQVSGVTQNDFTNPVAYVVTAADGTTKTYTVTVAIHGA